MIFHSIFSLGFFFFGFLFSFFLLNPVVFCFCLLLLKCIEKTFFGKRMLFKGKTLHKVERVGGGEGEGKGGRGKGEGTELGL